MIKRTLYAINTEDVRKVAHEEHTPVTKKDLWFIEDKIGDYLGDSWREAITYALNKLTRKK